MKDVVGKVESGEADAGLVYVTDATTAGDKVEKIDIPANNVINHYPIAATASPTNPEGAKAFIDAVTGTTGQEILAKYGFGAPGGASAAPSSGSMTAAPSSMPSAAPEASEAASPNRTGKPDEAGNKPDTETATP